MIIGVMSFSFVASGLTGIIQAFDDKNAEEKTRDNKLAELRYRYDFDEASYAKIRRAVEHGGEAKSDSTPDANWLIDCLGDPSHKDIKQYVCNTVFVRFGYLPSFFNVGDDGFFRTEDEKFNFLQWASMKLHPVELEHTEYGDYLKLNKGRAAHVYFLFDGNIEFELKQQTIAYRQMTRGIFGFEDYLYRLPEGQLHALYDERVIFCDIKLGPVVKNKFIVRHWPVHVTKDVKDYSNEVMSLKFEDIREMQHKFENVANKFCQHQIQQLRITLMRKLKLLSVIMGKDEPILDENAETRTQVVKAMVKEFSQLANTEQQVIANGATKETEEAVMT